MPYEDHNLESMIPFQFARSISNAFGQESIITPTNTLTLDAWFWFGAAHTYHPLLRGDAEFLLHL